MTRVERLIYGNRAGRRNSVLKSPFGPCHSEPLRFAQGSLLACHSDSEWSEEEESLYFAEGKLRESLPKGISLCNCSTLLKFRAGLRALRLLVL